MVNLKRLIPTDRSGKRDDLGSFILSQVTSSENARTDNTSLDPEAMADVLRMVGYVDACAAKNAEKLAGNPIHLYRPASRKGRAVRGRQASYLSGKSGVVRSKFNEQINVEDEGFELVEDHEALEVLRGPNPYLKTGTSLRFVLAYSREITGNSYAAYFPDEARMYPMNPGFTRIIPREQEGNLIDHYVYGRDPSHVMTLDKEAVHHQILRADFRQPYKGVSWLGSIHSTADLWSRTEAYLSQLMLNNGRPDTLIHFNGHQTQDQWKQTQNSIFARMRQKVARATGVFLTNSSEGGVSVHSLGHKPKDVESIQLLNEAEEIIWNAAGIPASVMRMDSSTMANANGGEYHWTKDTIMPRAVREADEWTYWLHEWFPETAEAGYFFAPDNCVPEDSDTTSRNAREWYQGGIVTRNEARSLIGFEPVDEGDDFIDPAVAPAMGASPDPFAALLGRSAKAEETPTLLVTSRAKEHDPGDESDHVNTNDATDPDVNDKPSKCSQGCDHTAKVWSQSEAFAKTPETLTGEGETESPELVEAYEGLSGVFNEQMDAVLSAMDAAPMGLKGANHRRYTDTKQFESFFSAWGIGDVSKWAAAMQASSGPAVNREYARTVVDSIRLIWDEADEELRADMPDPDDIDPESFIIEDDSAARVTRRFADRYAESMTSGSQTTADALARTLSEGLRAGEGLSDLQDRVRGVFIGDGDVTISEARAARIARTEVAQAQTEGRIAGMAGSRVVRGYKFVKANSACPICDAVDAKVGDQVFGVEDSIFPKGSSIQGTDGRTFKFDYQDTTVPIHPNCRCAVQPVLIDME